MAASSVNAHIMPSSRQFISHIRVLQPCTRTASAEAAGPLSVMFTIAGRVDSGGLIELDTCVNDEEFAVWPPTAVLAKRECMPTIPRRSAAMVKTACSARRRADVSARWEGG